MSLIRVLVFVFFSCLCFEGARAQVVADSFPTDSRLTLQAYQGVVEEHLLGVLRAEKSLAVTAEAQSGKWAEAKKVLEQLGKDLGTDAAIWYALPDGRYFTITSNVEVETLKDRPYFPKLISGESVFGDLVISKSTGHRSIIVAVPVKKSGKVVAAIGVSLRSRLVSGLVEKNMPLPEDMYFYALDPEQKVVIHRYPDRIFQHPAEIGGAELQPVFAEALKRKEGIFEYDLKGKRIQAVYRSSELMNWHFFLVRELK